MCLWQDDISCFFLFFGSFVPTLEEAFSISRGGPFPKAAGILASINLINIGYTFRTSISINVFNTGMWLN